MYKNLICEKNYNLKVNMHSKLCMHTHFDLYIWAQWQAPKLLHPPQSGRLMAGSHPLSGRLPYPQNRVVQRSFSTFS